MADRSPLRLDHLVILVRNLRTAIDNYRTLGFTVLPGGRHADGVTHNALIVLADDSYIELVAFTRRLAVLMLRAARRSGLLSRFISNDLSFGRRLRLRAAVTEGLVDFVLVPTAILRDVEAIRGRGLAIDGPIAGGRLRPDGQEVAWQLGFPRAPELPFLCADVTPRALRVPTGDARAHANGALGISRVTLTVDDVEGSARRYAALLGVEPIPGRADGSATSDAVFILGSSTIVVGSAVSTGRAAGALAATLRVANDAAARQLDSTLTGGAHIALRP